MEFGLPLCIKVKKSCQWYHHKPRESEEYNTSTHSQQIINLFFLLKIMAVLTSTHIYLPDRIVLGFLVQQDIGMHILPVFVLQAENKMTTIS